MAWHELAWARPASSSQDEPCTCRPRLFASTKSPWLHDPSLAMSSALTSSHYPDVQTAGAGRPHLCPVPEVLCRRSRPVCTHRPARLLMLLSPSSPDCLHTFYSKTLLLDASQSRSECSAGVFPGRWNVTSQKSKAQAGVDFDVRNPP